MAVINNLPMRGVKAELLWSNPNTSSDFASQTINVNKNLSDYEQVFILTKGHKANNDAQSLLCELRKDVTSYNKMLWIGWYNTSSGTQYVNYRQYRVTTQTNIWFGGGAYIYTDGGTATGNGYCVPIAIYGVKKKINK